MNRYLSVATCIIFGTCSSRTITATAMDRAHISQRWIRNQCPCNCRSTWRVERSKGLQYSGWPRLSIQYSRWRNRSHWSAMRCNAQESSFERSGEPGSTYLSWNNERDWYFRTSGHGVWKQDECWSSHLSCNLARILRRKQRVFSRFFLSNQSAKTRLRQSAARFFPPVG